MSTVPLAIILLPFLLFLILFFVFSIFNLYHVIHYGVGKAGKFAVIAIYAAGTLFFLGGSYIVLSRYDWERPLTSPAFLESVKKTNLFDLPTVPLREFNENDL